MHVLVAYDITDNRIRTKFHKFLKEFGLNTQKSVFECDLDREGIEKIASYARRHIDHRTDSVRLYRICTTCQKNVVVSGLGLKLLKLDFLIL